MRRVRVLSAAIVVGLGGAGAEASYKACAASAYYDDCECRGYRRGEDQVVAPSTHPTRAPLCNLINLQTAFDYAVDADGQGLTVFVLRGERYPLSGPVYALRGETVVETINDGVIRARAPGQRWTSIGSGPYPRISLPPFRGYEEHPPVGCVEAPGGGRESGRKPTSPNPRPVHPCPRYPKHQMQLFDAEGHRVIIDHLELDGGLDPSCAPRMPPYAGWRRHFERSALVELGGSALASGTAFHDNVVVNAAGWTALHLFEGPLDDAGAPACRDVEVHGNTFADLGYNLCDPLTGRDGDAPQCYWADGVSMACAGSVRRNTIRNPTDVGIVAFVGEVSIEDNVVSSDRGKAFGGIAAVTEFERSDGTWVANHDETVIARNTVRADPGGAFDIGVAVGLWAWSCAPRARPTFANSLVIANRIDAGEGRINYGLAVTLADGVRNEGLRVGSTRTCGPARCWEEFLPNTFRGDFGGGAPGLGCAGRSAGRPSPYVVNSCTQCWLQEGYAHAEDYKLLLGGIGYARPAACPR